jgi:hypothetical protein
VKQCWGLTFRSLAISGEGELANILTKLIMLGLF